MPPRKVLPVMLRRNLLSEFVESFALILKSYASGHREESPVDSVEHGRRTVGRELHVNQLE
jgi:hypothetical protein